jgi:AMMECR1 domain-containing protein
MIFIMISNIEGEQLVKLARKAVQKYLGEHVDINIDSLERFSQKTGVFVTLISVRSKEEQLRGCIGFPLSEKKLYCGSYAGS